MQSLLRLAAVSALGLLLAAPSCHGGHGYDLTLGPDLTLVASGPINPADSETKAFAQISWIIPAPWAGVTLLELWRYRDGDRKFLKLVSLAATDTGYTDSTLDTDTDYTYRLYAYFEKGPRKDSVDYDVRVAKPTPAKAKAAPAPETDAATWLAKLPGEPRLSPDGATIAYADGGRILLLGVATGAVIPLTRGDLGPETGAGWMPDGGSLVVAAGPPGVEDLWFAPRADGAAARLTATGLGARYPDVSPDGRRVAFGRADGIWVLRIATGATELVLPGAVFVPHWSPDGRHIAISAGAGR